MSLLDWIKFAQQALPLILQLIQLIETLIPVPKMGAQKRALLKGMMATVVPAGSVPDLDKFVDSVAITAVDAFNATGIFKH